MIKKKREHYREWRAEHPEAVKAANVHYWAQRAEEKRLANYVSVNRLKKL